MAVVEVGDANVVGSLESVRFERFMQLTGEPGAGKTKVVLHAAMAAGKEEGPDATHRHVGSSRYCNLESKISLIQNCWSLSV